MDGAPYFTAQYAKSGYWCISLSEDSKVKTCLSSSFGKYNVRVLPYGLTNSPAACVVLMYQVLHGLSHCVLAYVDDVLVCTKTNFQDHVHLVFNRLREHKIKLKMAKCSSARKQINILDIQLFSMESPQTWIVKAIQETDLQEYYGKSVASLELPFVLLQEIH